jgi:hypothetical protein
MRDLTIPSGVLVFENRLDDLVVVDGLEVKLR